MKLKKLLRVWDERDTVRIVLNHEFEYGSIKPTTEEQMATVAQLKVDMVIVGYGDAIVRCIHYGDSVGVPFIVCDAAPKNAERQQRSLGPGIYAREESACAGLAKGIEEAPYSIEEWAQKVSEKIMEEFRAAQSRGEGT